MKIVLVVAVVALGAASASAADVSGDGAGDGTGAWTVKANLGPKLRYTLVCMLTRDGQAVQGPCIATQGKTLSTHGRRAGDRMSFSYSTDYNGSGIRLAYDGVVQPDHTLKGVVTANGSKGVFQGERLMNSDADNTETWNLGVAFPGEIRYPVLCTFKADGMRLSGPCALTTGPTLHAGGTAEGSSVTFAYEAEADGRTVHVAYAGAVQPDGSVKGSVKAGDAVGSFSAAKP